MPTPIRIALIDDDSEVLEQLARGLARFPAIQCVAAATSGTVGIRKVGELDPDVVLVDMRMPVRDGAAVVDELRKLSRRPKILALTSYSDEHTFHRALTAGADGYLLKTDGVRRVASAILRAVNDESPLSAELGNRVLTAYRQRLAAQPSADLENLTDVQRKVLKLVGQGLNNHEIAAALGYTESTIRTYVSRLLKAADCRSRAELVVYAHRTKA